MTISDHRVRLRPATVVIGAGAGMSSGAALVIAIVFHRPLWLASTFVFAPGMIALAALAVALRPEQQALFFARAKRGLVAGVLATGAYDLIRWVVETTDVVGTRSFLAIRAFGVGLTGLPAEHAGAAAAGWAFHACNGIGFAVAYVLVAAGRPWALGIAFALGLEAAVVTLYPGWLGISLTREFLSVSILAHVAYSSVIGRFARSSP